LRKKYDYKWVKNLDPQEILAIFSLFDELGSENVPQQNGIIHQLNYSVMVLSTRASGIVLERDIRRMLPEYEIKRNPFLVLQKKIQRLFDLQSKSYTLLSTEDIDFNKIKILIEQCKEYLNKAYTAAQISGISLKTNKDLNRLREQLDRIKALILIVEEASKDENNEIAISLFNALLKIHATKIQLRKFIKNASQMYAFEVISHKAMTGEKYISKSQLEYYEMFKAALGGGFIVGILCVLKILLSMVDASYFGYAFLFSLNYALGFIIIYLMGFMLATKQPAMTASTLVSVLEKGLHSNVKATIRHFEFAKYFAQLFRTQFIAFLGNAIMAFPIALLGAWLIYYYNGKDIMGDKWSILIEDLHPIDSPALFHAAIAGVFLFISGVIAGDVANRNKFYKIPERIAYSPIIKRYISHNNREKLKKWYHKKWPGIASNFWFGVLMGTIAPIGIFLGLNLDIRHITFASGNFALGLFGANYELNFETVVWSILGIGLIGFMNFIVSFSLSLFLAFRAKNIPVKEIKPIVLSVLWKIKTYPFSFLYPSKTE